MTVDLLLDDSRHFRSRTGGESVAPHPEDQPKEQRLPRGHRSLRDRGGFGGRIDERKGHLGYERLPLDRCQDPIGVEGEIEYGGVGDDLGKQVALVELERSLRIEDPYER